MSVQKKEKAMWEMLDRFFLRVLWEKEGTAVMAESREQAASFLAGSQETSPSRRQRTAVALGDRHHLSREIAADHAVFLHSWLLLSRVCSLGPQSIPY